MNPEPVVIDRWRKFFRGADGNIFDVLEYAILVAASDCPKEFKIRRDDIAQKLFACRFTRCIGCESEAAEAERAVEMEVDGASEVCRPKETNVDSTSADNERNRISNNYSYDEAEAPTEEIEEESEVVDEVFRIKAVLENPDESEASLSESLRRLKLVAVSVNTLKVTEIGRVVSVLKKHASKEIRNLAKTLVRVWKDVVDEWLRTTASTVAGDSPDSVHPSTVVDDEEGLPSPPVDEGALLAPPLNSIDRDDDVKENQTREEDVAPAQKLTVPEGRCVRKIIVRRNSKIVISHSTTVCDSTSWAKPPPKPLMDNQLVVEPKPQQIPASIQMPTSAPILEESFKSMDDMSIRKKLEIAKRKLRERYQEAENAKKQRTIQVMELQDLPKRGGFAQRRSNLKPGFHNRHCNMRR